MPRFLDATADIGAAFPASYDPLLVIASYIVAALASYAGLLMSERTGGAERPRDRLVWRALGAVVMGIGVWAMHFTGMLAFSLPIRVGYDVAVTTLSAGPAIIASAFALQIMASHRRGLSHAVIGGALIGAGIGAMHYTGMAGMRLNADMLYDPWLFGMSILVAVLLGVLALYTQTYLHQLHSEEGGIRAHPLGAAIMGLAITGMHYTAMAGVYFFPRGGPPESGGQNVFWLGIAVAVVSILITLQAIAATMVSRRLRSAADLVVTTRQRMMEAIESLNDGFVLFDENGKLMMCNEVFRRMYPGFADMLKPGASYEELMTAWVRSRKDHPDPASAKAFVDDLLQGFKRGAPTESKAGEEQIADGRWVYVRQHPVKSGGLVAVWTDVTPIKELQAVYQNQAQHDALTRLPNRQLFNDRLKHAANHAKRLAQPFALLYLDLDGFKRINDLFGHDVGDVVLKEVAKRLRTAVRDTDTVARIGGDEFAVIIEPQGDREVAEQLAKRILDILVKPILVDGKPHPVGASIGLVVASPDVLDMEGLLKSADAAMYEAKRSGGHTYRIRE